VRRAGRGPRARQPHRSRAPAPARPRTDARRAARGQGLPQPHPPKLPPAGLGMRAFRRWLLKRKAGDGEWAGLLRPAPPGEWISLDLETTGLDPKQDHILSLAAVPVRDGRVLTSERFERRIR